jgi:hypothetical protein
MENLQTFVKAVSYSVSKFIMGFPSFFIIILEYLHVYAIVNSFQIQTDSLRSCTVSSLT